MKLRSRRKQRILLSTARLLNAPFIVVLLTAVLVNYVGVRLQDRAFRKNEVFKMRLARIEAAQNEVVQLRARIEQTFDLFRLHEETSRTMLRGKKPEALARSQADLHKQLVRSKPVAVLRRSEEDVKTIAESVGATGSSSIGVASSNFIAALKAFRGCIDANKTLAASCSEKHEEAFIGATQKLVTAYSKRPEEYLVEQD